MWPANAACHARRIVTPVRVEAPPHPFASTVEAPVSRSQAIWPLLSIDMVCDGVFMLLSGLCRGLGVQRRSAVCVILCLWCFGFPLQFFTTRSVADIWRCMIPIYALLDVGLLISALSPSWARLAADLQQGTSLAAADGSSSSTSTAESDAEGRGGLEAVAVAKPAIPEASPSRSGGSVASGER